ncbi:ORC-CDC6 family AAA ATPase [Microvirga alba]|uniref:Uncharacterized protein n=1 Tax=Microvirga alba TaxID=2791025 RepID=A0A931BP69_9HYPH|nr:hypothetical protein [Microvirga alba]MBF9234446.1 hypothetical protein [Microvirga alba]
MVNRLNPFRPTRWEHQREDFRLIWFTKTAEQLDSEKSIYVRGSRGSGKTTLLKSICWEDLTNNVSLKMQRTLADFSHIGIYVRFPDHLSSSLSSRAWKAAFDKPEVADWEFHKYFSLIVEITCIERMLHACHQLRLSRNISQSPAHELRFVDDVLEEFPALSIFVGVRPKTFLELSRLLRSIARAMNEAAGRGTFRELQAQLPAREPGELLAYASERLANGIRLVNPRGERQPGFRFCLDDCEVLDPLQQKSINTLVRISRFPISWVVSYVGAFFESTETFIDQQPLTEADRKVISLDSRNEDDFRELCQAVVSLRLLFSVSENVRNTNKSDNISDFFPLPVRLGRRDVNDMAAVMLQRSTSPIADELVRAASTLKDKLIEISKRHRTRLTKEGTALPIYESYLLLLWQGREDAFKTSFSPDDEKKLLELAPRLVEPAFEAWLRRKQRGALLQLAAVLGFRRLPLGGANVATSLADGSIRDFLEILGEIYESYTRRQKLDKSDQGSLDRFATSRTQIGWDIQADGIASASSSYHSSVSSRAELDSDIVMRLLDGLGYYTSILQSAPDDPAVLGRAERGVFTVRFSRPEIISPGDVTSDRERAVWRAIRQAEIAGYLRTIEVKFHDGTDAQEPEDQRGRTITFRLHRRFSPHYRFSFRGAYEQVVVTPKELWPLCDRQAPADARAWAEAMATRSVVGNGSQLPLPLGGDQDDE